MEPKLLLLSCVASAFPIWLTAQDQFVRPEEAFDDGRLGASWRVDVQLRPGFTTQSGLALLAMDVQRAPAGASSPGLGTFYPQNPNVVALLFTGAPSGTASLTTTVPAQPGLRGLELYLQGLAVQGTAAGLLPLVRLRVQ